MVAVDSPPQLGSKKTMPDKDSSNNPTSMIAKLSWEDELKSGKFDRSPSVFLHHITDTSSPADSSSSSSPTYPAEGDGRYHLYLSKACPWASRIEMSVRLTGMEIGMIFVDPHFQPIGVGRTGWVFSEEFPDPITGKDNLYQVYLHYSPEYTGKATTPMLLDTKTNSIVCNESADILKSIYWGCQSLHAPNTPDYYPFDRADEIEAWTLKLYEPLLNGVYKADFTRDQAVYDKLIEAMFQRLDELDEHLGKNKWMLGESFSVLDLIVGVLLCRFDAIYYVHFMCCKKHIYEYEHLSHYVRAFYQIPAVKASTDLEQCKRHYYKSHHVIAPRMIVGVANANADLNLPHNRDELFPTDGTL